MESKGVLFTSDYALYLVMVKGNYFLNVFISPSIFFVIHLMNHLL